MELARLEPTARPIVAVGASAGGLEALVVQHLDPQHPSILPDLLARYTAMLGAARVDLR